MKKLMKDKEANETGADKDQDKAMLVKALKNMMKKKGMKK